MSSAITTVQLSLSLVPAPPTTTAATHLRQWKASAKGQASWGSAHILPSLQRLCLALDQTQVTSYGLLLAPQFFTIFSRWHDATFIRLEERYWAAAEAGGDFWWNGTTLEPCSPRIFFSRLAQLPCCSSAKRDWRHH